MDNYAAYKTAKVKAWLAEKPQVPGALHPHLGLAAEPGGGVVRNHPTLGPAPGRRHLGG